MARQFVISETTTSTPSSLAWFLGAVSASLLILTYMLVAELSGHWVRTIAHDQLETLLQSSTPVRLSEAEPLLRKVFSDSFLLRRRNLRVLELYAATMQTFKLLDLANLNQIAEADNLWQESVQKLPYFMREAGRSPTLSKLMSRLNKSFGSYRELQERLISHDPKIRALKTELADLVLNYNKTADSFGALLGLTPLYTQDDNYSFQFYKSGLLKGTPVLYGLPDGVGDLQNLRAILERIGGSVHVQGENAHEEFNRRLSEIKDSGAFVLIRRQDITSRMRELELAERADNAKRDALKDLIRQSLVSLLSVLIGTLKL